jgi:hypothetical protein
MKRIAIRLGVLAATGLMLIGAPMAFAPPPAQAQGLYVQIGPRYGDDDRRERFCRAAYWHRDWRAMRWCGWHGAYGPAFRPYGPYYGPYYYRYR